jgi:crossover junction endodeoxyribonuclease RuvC
MRVLGVDPGLAITGYALVEFAGPRPSLVEAGTLRPTRDAPLPDRLRSLHADLTEVLRELRPDRVALESLFANYRFPRSALQMAHARGVVCLAAAQAGLEVLDIAPAEVKISVVGVGNATKEQVQLTIQALYGLAAPPTPADVADAIAIATGAGFRALKQ